MYNDSYEEYIRTILGYPRMQDISDNYMISQESLDFNYPMQNNSELENCYPEIYKVIYPMVEKKCRENVEPVTSELVDAMTNEIYMAIEGNEEVQININLNNPVSTENRKVSNTSNKTEEAKNNSKQQNNIKENRQVGQFRNRNLSDLIRILIIRELLGRPGFPGHRPPVRPRPPMRPPVRPPFPGGPGNGHRPPMRPPFPRGDIYQQMPEILENGYDIYEY